MILQNKGMCNEQLFCYTMIQGAQYFFPESVNISAFMAFSIFSLSSRRKLVAYLNSSQNFYLKSEYIYQGVMPVTSKVTTLLAIDLLAYVSVMQFKLKIHNS